MKFVDKNFSENVAKVAYIYGRIQDSLNDDLDLEDIINICVNITSDWVNMVDIKNDEEEGYITKYAERVLMEKYKKLN
jgi:hypothetical protein